MSTGTVCKQGDWWKNRWKDLTRNRCVWRVEKRLVKLLLDGFDLNTRARGSQGVCSESSEEPCFGGIGMERYHALVSLLGYSHASFLSALLEGGGLSYSMGTSCPVEYLQLAAQQEFQGLERIGPFNTQTQ